MSKPIRRRNQLPNAEVTLAALATTVAQAWQAAELPNLLWLTKADFAAQAASFVRHRDAVDVAGDARAPQSKRLKALDKLLDKGLHLVKGYLTEANEDSRAYYGEFGIEKANGKYGLPAARPERVKSLHKLLAALKAHDFDTRKYGTAHWQPLATEYAELVERSTATTGERSGKVSSKAEGKKQVRQALQALIHHIKANYSDTFEAQLRAFGLQKESY